MKEDAKKQRELSIQFSVNVLVKLLIKCGRFIWSNSVVLINRYLACDDCKGAN